WVVFAWLFCRWTISKGEYFRATIRMIEFFIQKHMWCPLVSFIFTWPKDTILFVDFVPCCTIIIGIAAFGCKPKFVSYVACCFQVGEILPFSKTFGKLNLNLPIRFGFPDRILCLIDFNYSPFEIGRRPLVFRPC